MSAEVSDTGWDRRRQLLLTEYERVALELFAARGFRSVTVDDIAEAAGVSARTLFRYFPTKEDFLLGFPRRGAAATTEALDALEPSDTPLVTAWQLIRDAFLAGPDEAEPLNLWRRAAADAPEVVDRVRGERTQAVLDAVAAYCARSTGARSTDLDARMLGGIVAGVELAVVEAWGRSKRPLPAIVDAADHSIHLLEASRSRGR